MSNLKSKNSEAGYVLKLDGQLMIHNIALDVEREWHRLNISENASRTGYNWRTVKKFLASSVDQYKPFIRSQLSEYPQLSARRIFREIQNQGYGGGYTILTDYLRSIREKKPTLTIYRYETKPGHQAQVDWETLVSSILTEKNVSSMSSPSSLDIPA